MSDYEHLRNQGIGYKANKEWTKAIECLLKAYNLKNMNEDLLEDLGYSYFKIQDYSNAIFYYEKINADAIEDIAKKTGIYYLLAACHALKQNEEEVKQYIAKLTKYPNKDNEKNMVFTLLISTFVKVKNYDKACKYYDVLLCNKKDDVNKLMEYGKCLLEAGRTNESLKVHLDVYNKNPTNIKNINSIINIYYNNFRLYKESCDFISKFLEVTNEKKDSNEVQEKLLLKAICLSKTGDDKSGESILMKEYNSVKEKLGNTNSSFVTANAPIIFINISKFYIETGNFDKGTSFLKESRRLYPKDYRFYELEIDLYFSQGKHSFCKEIMVSAEDNHKNDPFFAKGNLCKYLANKFMSKSNIDDAIYCIEKLINLQKDNIDAYIKKGSLLFEKKEFKKAIEVYLKSISIKESGKAYLMISLCYQKLDDYINAIEYLDKAISKFPTYIKPYFNKIIVLIHEKKFDNALEVINSAESIIPKADEDELKREVMIDHLNELRKKRQISIDFEESLKRIEKEDKEKGSNHSKLIKNMGIMFSKTLAEDQARTNDFFMSELNKLREEFEKNKQFNAEKFLEIGKRFEEITAFKNNVYEIIDNKFNDSNIKNQIKSYMESQLGKLFNPNDIDKQLREMIIEIKAIKQDVKFVFECLTDNEKAIVNLKNEHDKKLDSITVKLTSCQGSDLEKTVKEMLNEMKTIKDDLVFNSESVTDIENAFEVFKKEQKERIDSLIIKINSYQKSNDINNHVNEIIKDINLLKKDLVFNTESITDIEKAFESFKQLQK